MNGKCRNAAYAEHGVKCVGTWAQMRNAAQKFKRMPLFLQRIFRRGRALDLNFLRFELKGLLCLRCQYKSSANDKRRTDILLCNFLVIGKRCVLKYDLQIAESRSVVQLDKAEGIACANGSCPAADGNALARIGLRIGKQFAKLKSFHCFFCLSPCYFTVLQGLA